MFGTPSQAKILSVIEENCSQECFGDVAKLRTPLSHSLFSSSLVINPRCMREGYGSQSVCVCVFVCYHANCYIPHFCVDSKVS